jgi:hypothetical protein
MPEFLVNFLAEVGLSIALLCLTYAFLYKGGRRWKMLSLVFLAVVSPFYLSQKDFFSIWLIPVWLFLTPIGIFILLRNIKISAYNFVLNSSKLKPRKKPVEKKSKELSRKLKSFEQLTYILFATIFVNILSLSFHKSLEFLQVPLQLMGTVILFAIAIFYTLADKNSTKSRLRATLISFLSSSYVTMSYAFLNLILYLYAYLSISLFYSTMIATFVLGVFFVLAEHALLSIKRSIISAERDLSISESFSRYFNANTIISLILILVFSDSLVVYSMFLEQSIETMIMWTYLFFIFISGFYLNFLRTNLEFKVQIGLIERPKLEEEFNRLIGKTNEKNT